MIQEKIKELIDKIPIGLILTCYLAYLGYDYYSFANSGSSPLGIKKAEIAGAKNANAKLQKKIKELDIFVKNLETKKSELRNLAQELQNMKGTLSENLDLPLFMKMVFTEAKKVGISVESLEPIQPVAQEYYSEIGFKMTFKGVFSQLIDFLDRLSNVTQIIRADRINLNSTGVSAGKYAEIHGELIISTYKYQGSKADVLGKVDNSSNSQEKQNSRGVEKNTTPMGPKSSTLPAHSFNWVKRNLGEA